MPKLTESSKAVVLPQKKLRNGDISLSDNAKYVWESDPIFIQHKLDNFWTNFNRIKAEEEQAEGKVIFYKRNYLSFEILFLNQTNNSFR